MEEHVLRCNYQNQNRGYCRAELKLSAVVTTCSHVFCKPCAVDSGFANVAPSQRRCPACTTPLPTSDDAVEVVLNPSEDYKTSILSGLDPSIIMECASRALSFWNYQVSQETAYQKHMLSALTRKYSHLSTATDKVILEANTEMESMQSRISALVTSNTDLQRKNADYMNKDRERTKKFNDLRRMYDTLKQRYQSTLHHDASTAGAHHAVQHLTDSIIPPRDVRGKSSQFHVHDASKSYMGPQNSFSNVRYYSRGSDYHDMGGKTVRHASDGYSMPPPAMPLARNGVSPGAMNRVMLPGSVQAVAKHRDAPANHLQHFHPNPGTHNRIGHSRQFSTATVTTPRRGTANSHGGLFAGMKVGSANVMDSHGEYAGRTQDLSSVRRAYDTSHQHSGSLPSNLIR